MGSGSYILSSFPRYQGIDGGIDGSDGKISAEVMK